MPSAKNNRADGRKHNPRPASPHTTAATKERTPSTKRHPLRVADLREITTVSTPVFAPDGSAIAFVARKVCTNNNYKCTIHLADPKDPGRTRRFTNGPRDTAPRFSPDGQHILFISSRTGSHQLFSIPTAGGEPTQLTDLPEGVIRDLAVAPTGHRIAFAFRETPRERTAAAREKRREKHASEPPIIIDELWHKQDGDGFFASARFALHTLDTASLVTHTLYAPKHHDAFTFDFAPDGRTIALAANRHKHAAIHPRHTELLLLDADTGSPKAIPNMPPGPKSAPRWSPDGSTIAYAGRTGPPDDRAHDGLYSSYNLELFVCSPDTGNPRNLTQAADHCLLAASIDDSADADFAPNLRFTPDSKRIVYRLGLAGATRVASVPRGGGTPTLHTPDGVEAEPGGIAPDSAHIAVVYATPTRPPQLAVTPLAVRTKTTRKPPKNPAKTGEITVLSRCNDAFLRTRDVAAPAHLDVTSADGTPVQTRILLPPAHTAGAPSRAKLPAVVPIHGGPHAQYGSGFFHELQTLAAAGFAVIYPNPRGSKGFGESFCNAIRGKWGFEDLEDVNAVIDAAMQHPDIDPKRVAVIGGSYGGYMTNRVIAHRTDLCAAITDRCVANLVSFLGNTDMVQPPGRYFPGRFFDDTAALEASSPIRQVANVRTPTLIIHSEGDLRCNIEQSEQVFTALKMLGVQTRFIRYPRCTSHGMSRNGPPDLREHRLTQMLDWLTTWTARRSSDRARRAPNRRR